MDGQRLSVTDHGLTEEHKRQVHEEKKKPLYTGQTIGWTKW